MGTRTRNRIRRRATQAAPAVAPVANAEMAAPIGMATEATQNVPVQAVPNGVQSDGVMLAADGRPGDVSPGGAVAEPQGTTANGTNEPTGQFKVPTVAEVYNQMPNGAAYTPQYMEHVEVPTFEPLAEVKREDAPYSKVMSAIGEDFKPKTKEELEAEKKRERRDKLFSSIGDAISSLSNLYFTTKGAPNMYDPSQSLSGKARERWDRLHKEYEANKDRYLNRRLQIAQMDENWFKDAQNVRRQLEKQQQEAINRANDTNFKIDTHNASETHKAMQYQLNAETKRFNEAKGLVDDLWRRAEAARAQGNKDEELRLREKYQNAQIALDKQRNALTAQSISLRAKIHSDNLTIQNRRLAQQGGSKNQVVIPDARGGYVTVDKSRVNKATIGVVYNMLPEDVRVKFNTGAKAGHTGEDGELYGMVLGNSPDAGTQAAAIASYIESGADTSGNIARRYGQALGGGSTSKGKGYGSTSKGKGYGSK